MKKKNLRRGFILREKHGITLVALVITIIVLLILAGVTVELLIGENGILSSARSANKNTILTQIEEKIKLALIASRMNAENGFKINETIFEEELKNSFGEELVIKKQGENNSLPWMVTINKYKFKINSNETLEEINEARNYSSLDMAQITSTSDGDTGLFYLRNLVNENANYKYTESTKAYYWLSTVLTARSNNFLAMTWYNGYFDGTNEDASISVRPVITLNANIRELTEGYWEIVK